MRKRLLILASLCVLLGCSDSPDSTYATYNKRLAKFLPITELDNPTLTPWPALHGAPTSSKARISILDLAKLQHCELGQLIAQHNSQLGKVALPSERFKYHVRFIALAQQCLKKPKTAKLSHSIIAALQDELAHKKATLGDSYTHMLANEPELKRLFALSSQPLGFEQNAGLSNTIEALSTLAGISDAIAAKNPLPNIDALTPALKKLNQTQYSAQLLTATRLQIARNQSLTNALQQVDVTKSVCVAHKNRNEAKILSNIFSHFYLKQLQGYQAQLDGALTRLMPYYQRLLAHSSDSYLHAALLGHDLSPSLHQQLKNSARDHVTWWQNFYKTCQIKPI